MYKKLLTSAIIVIFLLSIGSMAWANTAPGRPDWAGPPWERNSSEVQPLNEGDEEEPQEEEETVDEAEEFVENEAESETKDKSKVINHPHKEDKKIGPPAFVLDKLENIRVLQQEKLKVRGNPLIMDVPPVIKEGRTLIPVRAVTMALGASVDWDADEKKVTINRDDIEIIIYLYEFSFFVNGEEMELDVPAQLISNRTFVPLRFIAQALGERVDYNDETEEIEISANAKNQDEGETEEEDNGEVDEEVVEEDDDDDDIEDQEDTGDEE